MRLRVQTTIDAPAERVFAAVSDFAAAPAMIDGVERVEMLTDGPVGVGTRFGETRVVLGRRATEQMEVTDFQPGRSLTLGATSCGVRFETLVRCTPEGARTRLSYDVATRPLTLGARLAGALTGPIMAATMRKQLTKDLQAIGAHLEGAAAAKADGARRSVPADAGVP